MHGCVTSLFSAVYSEPVSLVPLVNPGARPPTLSCPICQERDQCTMCNMFNVWPT